MNDLISIDIVSATTTENADQAAILSTILGTPCVVLFMSMPLKSPFSPDIYFRKFLSMHSKFFSHPRYISGSGSNYNMFNMAVQSKLRAWYCKASADVACARDDARMMQR